jgi:hypothetical protein
LETCSPELERGITTFNIKLKKLYMNPYAKKRYKDMEFPFTCPITKREFNSGKGLSVYLTKTLKVDHSEYYDNYINHGDSSFFSVLVKF